MAQEGNAKYMTGRGLGDQKKIGLCLFCLLFFFYSYVHQGTKDQIALSRLDLLYSVVLHGEIYIDRYHENTIDKAIHGGHYYCDKAPLTVMLALPAFCAAMAIEKALGIDPESPRGWEISSWVTCIGSLGFLTALSGFIAFRMLLFCVDMRTALVCTLGIYLGAAPFPYATTLYSQALTVSLLTFALYFLFLQNSWLSKGNPHGHEHTFPKNSSWPSALSGLCCGLAIAAEYSAGLVASFILLFCIYLRPRNSPAMCLGTMLGVVPIPLYHALCFGNPFTIAYQHEAQHFPEMREGFFGIRFPPFPHVVIRELIGLDFGLLVWTPLLALSLVGFYRFIQLSKAFALGSSLICLLHLIVIAGYAYLFASGTIGARLLAPILPLWIIPTALGAARFPRAGALLAGLSVLLTGGATLVSISFSGAGNPLRDYYWPALKNGQIASNLGGKLGLTGTGSLLPLLFVGGIAGILMVRFARTSDGKTFTDGPGRVA